MPSTSSTSTPAAALSDTERRLPLGYYLDNFERVLEIVESRYSDLLLAPEQAFLDRFRSGSLAARRLYVRAISRKGPYLRRDRLRYEEVPDLDGALEELIELGLMTRPGEAQTALQHSAVAATAQVDEASASVVDDALACLLRAEIVDLLASFELEPPAPGERKTALLQRLRAKVDSRRLVTAVARKVDLVQPLGHDILLLVRLLFFGNLHQDWSEFVVRDLGVQRYESYEIRRDERLFPDRRAIEDHLELRQLRRRTSNHALRDGASEEVIAAAASHALSRSWHPSARRVLDRLLVHAGRQLERQGRLDQAAACYRQAVSPPARERRARLLAQEGDLRAAIELCGQIADDPLDETEAVFAPGFRDRLYRRLGARFGSARKPRRRHRHLRLANPPHGSIERAVLQALGEVGEMGCFAENGLWKSLFGLAFWDVIFAPLPGAFQHPFQLAPIDLQLPEFRRRRRALIEQRLEELRQEEDVRPRLESIWRVKHGIANALVSWSPYTRRSLDLVLPILHGRHLAHVSDRLSRDVRRYRRGLPDLLVLREREPGFILYEVKGPSDQLRPEQGGRIDYLDAGGLPTEILDVDW